MKQLNWAVLGCGVIANEMAQALEHMGKHLYAVGNRTRDKAVAFAENTKFRKFTMIFMRCLKIRMWMSFISQHHTIHILSSQGRHSPMENMFCAKNP